MVLVSGLRSYYLGSGDTSRYADMFFNYSHLSYDNIIKYVERDPIYHIFTIFLHKVIGLDFQGVLLVIAAIYVFAYDRLVYKESPNLLISYILLYAMGFFTFSMHGVRQSLAIACTMLAYFPLKEKKLMQFIIIVLLGACFHKSALIFLVTYPLCRLGFSRKSLLFYGAIIITLFMTGDELIRSFASDMSSYDERLSYYAVTDASLNMSGFIQLCLFLVMLMTNLKTYMSKDKEAPILITLLILAIIFQTCAIFIAEMFRVAMYFSTFLVVLVPRFLKSYAPENRKLVTVVLCTLLLLYFYSTPYYLQYDFYWNDFYKVHYYNTGLQG